MMSVLSGLYGSRRQFANSLFILLVILVTLISANAEYSQDELEAMTEAELEDICVKRGFQLVKEEYGDNLEKQDYIEAAQRCLAIEQEMNELLAQYPELADELEEEIKRMENENAEKQAYVDSLENRITETDVSADNSHSNDPGTAFGLGSKNNDSNRGGVGDDGLDMSDEVPVNEQIEETNSHGGEKSYSSGISSDDSELDDLDEQDTEATDTNDSAGNNLETRKKATETEDLTLTHIAVESFKVLIKNAQDDVRRIINLAIPALKPLFNAGDVAWRQMKALFNRARELYEAYQATNVPSGEETGELETCDT